MRQAAWSVRVGILALAALAGACGGGGGDEPPASTAPPTSEVPATVAKTDLRLVGKLSSLDYNSAKGLVSVRVDMQITVKDLSDGSCTVSPSAGLQLTTGTQVAIEGHRTEAGDIKADQITCQPSTGHAFKDDATTWRVVGEVSQFKGEFQAIIPEWVVVRTPTIDTTGAPNAGCVPNNAGELPPQIVVRARWQDGKYVATRVECT